MPANQHFLSYRLLPGNCVKGWALAASLRPNENIVGLMISTRGDISINLPLMHLCLLVEEFLQPRKIYETEEELVCHSWAWALGGRHWTEFPTSCLSLRMFRS